MLVLNSIQQSIIAKYCDPKFKSMAEQNIDYALLAGNFTLKTIDPQQAYVYQGNLFGLFSSLGIRPEYQAYNAYLNGYRSPHDYDGETLVIKILPESVIDNIAKISY